MIDVSESVKTAYKTDRFPLHTEPIEKHLYIKVLDTGTVITEANLESENFTLEESICSEQNVTFGACEASMVSFAVYNIPEELNQKMIEISQEVNGESVPLGTYRIETATKRDGDARWRDITAYDRMTELDKDVTVWYEGFWNGRTSATIKEFRVSFFAYMGFDIVDQELPNDNVTITKTINPESVKGRYIAQMIGEVNGCFGHFTRENKFKYISLSALSLYPSETLYPAEDLFPAESSEIMTAESAVYFSSESHYEDYFVQAIDSVTFRNSDETTGYTVGDTQNNPYIIENNFLLFGKSNAELKEIADNFLLMAKNKIYMPSTTVMIGLPYLEAGDTIAIVLEQDTIETFIFQRRLTGIQNLMDEITATGTEYRRDESTSDGELLVLKTEVEKNTEDIEQNAEDIEEINENVGNLNISLQKTDSGLQAEVSRAISAEESLSSQISMTESEISSKVSKGDVVSEINQSAEAIRLSAGRLIIDSGNFLLDENGKATATDFAADNSFYIKSAQGYYIFRASDDSTGFGTSVTFGDIASFLAGAYVQDYLNANCDLNVNGDSKLNGGIWSNATADATTSSSANGFINASTGHFGRSTGSSRRWKHDICDIANGELNPHKLYDVKPRQFKYNNDYISQEDGRYGIDVTGFIAEELAEDYPICVEYDEYGIPSGWSEKYIIPPMLALIQEQHREIETLKSQILNLQGDLEILKQEVEEMKNA